MAYHDRLVERLLVFREQNWLAIASEITFTSRCLWWVTFSQMDGTRKKSTPWNAMAILRKQYKPQYPIIAPRRQASPWHSVMSRVLCEIQGCFEEGWEDWMMPFLKISQSTTSSMDKALRQLLMEHLMEWQSWDCGVWRSPGEAGAWQVDHPEAST